MINSDKELEEKIKNINASILEVHKYIGSEDPDKYDNEKYMIGLPWDYLTELKKIKKKLDFIEDATIKKNISDSLRLSDIYCWLLNRTNISFDSREMLIKHGIVLMGSVCETIVEVLFEKNKPKVSFKKKIYFNEKITHLKKIKKITEQIKKDLIWLWDMRQGVHIFLMDSTKKYIDADYSRAVITAQNLIDHLKIKS